MKWLLVALALLIAAPTQAQSAAGSSTAMTPTPDDRAKQWLMLIDDQNYAAAYRQMGPPALDRENEQDFTTKMAAARQPLGAMSSRTLKDVQLARSLPGVPDGQYAVVRYDSSFARKMAVIEQVTLVSENSAWSVIGYFIH